MTQIDDLAATVERSLTSASIAAFLDDCLARVNGSDDLLRFCARFSLYNRPFPGAVLALASGLHFRHDAFADDSDPIVMNRDRSSTIASHVLYAAEDEFAAPDRRVRLTHRTMAQRVVADAIGFAGWEPHEFNKAYAEDVNSDSVADALRSGYGVGRFDDDASLFRGLGFHIGSERLAQTEFSLLDAMLRDRFPDFVVRASASRNRGDVATYTWIDAHTVLEVEHYRHSLIAADLAEKYYVGDQLEWSELSTLIQEGLAAFMRFQRQMFSWLLEDGQNG